MLILTYLFIIITFVTNLTYAKERPDIIVEALSNRTPFVSIAILKDDVKIINDTFKCLTVTRNKKEITITSTAKLGTCAPYYEMHVEKSEKSEAIIRVTESEAAQDPSRTTNPTDSLDNANPTQQTTTFDDKGKITSQTTCSPNTEIILSSPVSKYEKLSCYTVTPDLCQQMQISFAQNPPDEDTLEKCGMFIKQLNNAVSATVENTPSILSIEKENIDILNKKLKYFTQADKSYFPDLITNGSSNNIQDAKQIRTHMVAKKNILGFNPLRNVSHAFDLCESLRSQLAEATRKISPQHKTSKKGPVNPI